MGFGGISWEQVLDLFILLLIGMGPKIALVPFLGVTANMDRDTKKQVANAMVRTAVGMAIFLVILGGLLMRLLHFTPGAIQIAGGIVLVLIALRMVMKSEEGNEEIDLQEANRALDVAVYPLAVPYLLNPAGIAVLITVSGTIDSIFMFVIIIGVVLLVGALDMLVFRHIDGLAKHLNKSRLVLTEAVFGVLLAALAIQLMLEGLQDVGVILLDISH